MKLLKNGALVGATVALSLTLAACAGGAGSAPSSDPTSAPSSAATGEAATQAFNDADVMFAQMMIVHHEGAMEMADLAVEKAEGDDVRTLAEGISAAQGPEIEEMTSWLEAWGEPMAMGGMAMGGMAMGGMDMGGMSQEDAMAELEGLSGTDFDRRFLELMIEHHRGAVSMAETQLEDGENEQALALAEQVITDQEAEIAEMEQMLAEL